MVFATAILSKIYKKKYTVHIGQLPTLKVNLIGNEGRILFTTIDISI